MPFFKELTGCHCMLIYKVLNILIGVNKRTKEVSKMQKTINDLKENHTTFEKDFFSFFYGFLLPQDGHFILIYIFSITIIMRLLMIFNKIFTY